MIKIHELDKRMEKKTFTEAKIGVTALGRVWGSYSRHSYIEDLKKKKKHLKVYSHLRLARANTQK